MTVTINGTATELRDGARVDDALAAVDGDPTGRGTAIAVNGTVVPRRAWSETFLSAGDRVEVLTAVAGG